MKQAAKAISESNYLVITAGAGMGVDSGLPDFRGNQGFWKAYPPFAKLNLSLPQVSTPKWFDQDPEFAWGFFGHRHQLYTKTLPHQGYKILLQWANSKKYGYSIYTSNVDGHFQKAGFDKNRIQECHGSIHYLQCSQYHFCSLDIWPTGELPFKVNSEFRAQGELPKCRNCGKLARPNILMFGDFGWVEDRTQAQHLRFQEEFFSLPRDLKVCVVEIGAGLAVPTVRMFGERMMPRAELVRINPVDLGGNKRVLGIKANALEGLQELKKVVK